GGQSGGAPARWRLRSRRRELDLHPRAAPGRGVDAQPAAVAIDDRAGDRHTETRAVRLGGVEELEQPGARLLVHAAAGVGDVDLDTSILATTGTHGERAAVLHRVEPVHHQVEDRLL